MNRYEILAFLPLWVRYLPICLAIFIAAVKTTYIITLKVRKKTDKINNSFFGAILALQLIHYTFIAGEDILFEISIILLIACCMLHDCFTKEFLKGTLFLAETFFYLYAIAPTLEDLKLSSSAMIGFIKCFFYNVFVPAFVISKLPNLMFDIFRNNDKAITRDNKLGSQNLEKDNEQEKQGIISKIAEIKNEIFQLKDSVNELEEKQNLLEQELIKLDNK